MHGGNFKKGVTVKSNAKNHNILRLYLGGSIKPFVGVDKSYIRLKSTANDSEIVKLESQKSDLKIKEVIFNPDKSDHSTPLWAANTPLVMNYSLKKEPEVKGSGGYEKYTLILKTASPVDFTRHGRFLIKTNHPKRKEIQIRGMIQAKSEHR